ncbi:MAG: hypothetical protein NTY39_10005 [Campylobacterales bacterium]|nr:hypothetical protein [Campylobacterales bacterium]
MKRFAFTLLELVFIIIVIGILAVLAMPNFSRNSLAEGVEKIAAQIRYTQHLAMVDDKYNPADPNWREENWQIWFRIYLGSYYYEIFSDRNGGANSNANEEAIDPLTRKSLANGIASVGLPINKDLDLTAKYGITSMVVQSGNCASGSGFQIAFDSLGRPYGDVTYQPVTAPYYKIFTTPCQIRITHGDSGKTADINVSAVTGYVSVVYN